MGNALVDPMTGEKRAAYSFRHLFAKLLIERRLSVAAIAEWLGSSSAMVEKHYNRFLVERQAHLVNGAEDEPLDHIGEEGTPWHWDPANLANGCRDERKPRGATSCLSWLHDRASIRRR